MHVYYFWVVSFTHFSVVACDQEAKAKAGLKAQIDKLQQERDEFQKMVIGNQVIFCASPKTPSCFVSGNFAYTGKIINVNMVSWYSKSELNRYTR